MKVQYLLTIGIIAFSLFPCPVEAASSTATGSMYNLTYTGTDILILPDDQWPVDIDWASSFSGATAYTPWSYDTDSDEAGTLEATSALATVGYATGTASTAQDIWGISTNASASSPAWGYSYAYAEAWQDMAIQVQDAQILTIEADYELSYSMLTGQGEEAYAFSEAGLLIWDGQDSFAPLAEDSFFLGNWIFDVDSVTDLATGTLSIELALDPGIYVLDMWLVSSEAGAAAAVPVPGAVLLCLLGGAITTRMRRLF